MAFENIPLELRQCTQWQNWRYKTLENGRETKVPINPHNGYDGSTINPATWSSFEHACYNAGHYNVGIGLVFTKAFGKSGIDCDNFNLNNPWHARLFEQCQTYAEYSPSGKGVHFICNGIIPSGVNNRANDMELYCEGRFFTFTGNVLQSHNLPITDQQTLLLELYERLASHAAEIVVNSQAETLSDDDVIKRAYAADNGAKFAWLFEGRGLIEGTWQASGEFPSQSEADQALVNILQFYAPNAEQIKRIFLRSALATTLARKPKQDYYLGLTIKKSFDRAVPLVTFTGLAEGDPRLKLNGHASAFPAAEPIDPPDVSSDPFLEPLPGLVGITQSFVLAASPKPLPVAATLAALAQVAGIAGRAYNVLGNGLNIYGLLLAPTGTGKEGMRTALNRLIAAVKGKEDDCFKAIEQTCGPASIGSYNGLIKYIADNPCFLSMLGEFSSEIKRYSAMDQSAGSSNNTGLGKAFCELYTSSGANQTYAGIIFSNKANNVQSIQSPAFSVLADSTVEHLYKNANEDMVHSGLLPRFEVVEHTGGDVDTNYDARFAVPSRELVFGMRALAEQSFKQTTKSNWLPIEVKLTPEALTLHLKFEAYVKKKVKDRSEFIRGLWTRLALRALKLAGLVAVGCNVVEPTIDNSTLEWAQRAVVFMCENVFRHHNNGDFGGSGDRKAETVLADAILKYYTHDFDTLKGYQPTLRFYNEKIIDRSFIARCIKKQACFNREYDRGMTFERVLKAFEDNGVLRKLDRLDERRAKLRSNGQLYELWDYDELLKFTSNVRLS